MQSNITFIDKPRPDAHAHGGDHGHDHAHHVTSIPMLFGTFMVLVLGMAATIAWYYIGMAEWVPSWLNNIIALGIAVTKAMFVIQIFMGVKWSSNLVKSYVILGFVWASLLTMMFIDYASRSWEPVRGWTGEQTTAMPRAHAPLEDAMPERKDIVIPKHEKGSH